MSKNKSTYHITIGDKFVDRDYKTITRYSDRLKFPTVKAAKQAVNRLVEDGYDPEDCDIWKSTVCNQRLGT